MFKTGEQVVMTDADDYNSIFTVVGKPFCMYQLSRLDTQIRHATSEEVAAGHRIESSNNQAISDCSLSNLSINESQSDLSIKQDGQDMGDDTHIENHISPNCRINCFQDDTEIGTRTVDTEAENERLKTENLAMQSKIDELQKRVDAVKQLIEEYRDPPTEDKTFQHALSIVAYELEQALKGENK